MKFTRLASAVVLATTSLPILAASYTVTELPASEISENQYGSSVDNTGLVLATFQNNYNPPIDLRLIDLDSDFFAAALTDIDAVRNGDPNLSDYNFLTNYVRTGSNNFSVLTQQLGQFLGFKYVNDSFEYVNAFDEESDELGGFSFSMETTLRDSTNGTHIIGNTEGPNRILEYTNENGDVLTYNVFDFDRRGFVQVGDNTVGLVPADTTLGGSSQVNSINQNYVVAGVGSVAPSDALVLANANCLDEETRGDQPVEVCQTRLRTSTSGNGTVSRRSGLWTERATLWSLDVEGNIVDTTVYGTLVTDEEEIANAGTSQALDVNVNGVAVGVASLKVGENQLLSTAAAIFQNGEVSRIIEDDDFLPNSALHINDNSYVTGVRSERINNVFRSRMYVYDLSNDDIDFVDGFFVSSSTLPRAMNNENIIVGTADVDVVTGTSQRPTAGFMYDIESQTFTNLNNLLPCGTDYNIIEALDINDSNVIVASASTKRPARNVRGEILTDDDGNEVLIDAVVAVMLNPTGAEPSDCSADEDTLERQGASTGILMFAMLFVASIFRRRK
jgi:hypothetical protein